MFYRIYELMGGLIDSVLYYTQKMFDTLSQPLSNVFKNSNLAYKLYSAGVSLFNLDEDITLAEFIVAMAIWGIISLAVIRLVTDFVKIFVQVRKTLKVLA